jgi:hypothetical protein
MEIFTSFLAWCTLINLVILILWWFFLNVGDNWMRRMHGKMFDLSEEGVATAHYNILAHFKLLWVIFTPQACYRPCYRAADGHAVSGESAMPRAPPWRGSRAIRTAGSQSPARPVR